MKFKFNPDKNEKLIAERGIGFDQISDAIERKATYIIKDHHNKEKYPNQKIIYVLIDEEVYSVPCIKENDETYFLKTVFPDRVARKEFLKNKKL